MLRQSDYDGTQPNAGGAATGAGILGQTSLWPVEARHYLAWRCPHEKHCNGVWKNHYEGFWGRPPLALLRRILQGGGEYWLWREMALPNGRIGETMIAHHQGALTHQPPV